MTKEEWFSRMAHVLTYSKIDYACVLSIYISNVFFKNNLIALCLYPHFQAIRVIIVLDLL
jgi:hypothetical protein